MQPVISKKMKIHKSGYFDRDREDQEFMQKLALHQFLAEALDMGLSDAETIDFMKEQMYWFEDEEEYESAALIRDALKIYLQDIEQRG